MRALPSLVLVLACLPGAATPAATGAGTVKGLVDDGTGQGVPGPPSACRTR